MGARVRWAVAAGVVISLGAVGASAQDRRVVVGEFDGRGGDEAREGVLEALGEQSGIEVVPDAELEERANALGSSIGSLEVAEDVGAAALIEAEVGRRGRNIRVTITVRDVTSGDATGDFNFQNRRPRRLGRLIARDFWRRLGDAVESTTLVEEEEEEFEEEEEDEEEEDEEDEEEDDEEEEEDGGGAELDTVPLAIWAGLRLFNRNYSYEDDIFDALRSYDLPLGPMIRGRLAWYPGAHFTDGIPAHIGIVGTIDVAVGLVSGTENDQEFSTSSLAWSAGAEFGIPIERHEVALYAGFGQHSFSLEDTNDQGENRPVMPNISYSMVKVGLRGRIAFEFGLYFEPAFNYLILVSASEIGDDMWFPRQGGGGIEGSLRVGFMIAGGFGVQLGFELQRYFFSLSPEPGDPWVAGGALDQYISGLGEVVWRLGDD